MKYKINNPIYNRINSRFENGTYTTGKNRSLPITIHRGLTIDNFPLSERTPELYASLLAYGQCSLSDVPVSSRTKEFFIATFTDNEIYMYIKNHQEEFDKQFYKDLIVTNEMSTKYITNCFSVMPLEYIYEEMCSIAIIYSTNYNSYSWFFTVVKRKPTVLTEELWKLATRLYANPHEIGMALVKLVPEKYRDKEFYKEMCKCNFFNGRGIVGGKGKITKLVPRKILNGEFLLDLLMDSLRNITTFSEEDLEKEYEYIKNGHIFKERMWEYTIRADGNMIMYIDLNEERIEFFLKRYSKDSPEYRHFFKDKYEQYLLQQKKDMTPVSTHTK